MPERRRRFVPGTGRGPVEGHGERRAFSVHEARNRRRSQVAKAKVCKTFIRRFESGRRLHQPVRSPAAGCCPRVPAAEPLRFAGVVEWQTQET